MEWPEAGYIKYDPLRIKIQHLLVSIQRPLGYEPNTLPLRQSAPVIFDHIKDIYSPRSNFSHDLYHQQTFPFNHLLSFYLFKKIFQTTLSSLLLSPLTLDRIPLLLQQRTLHFTILLRHTLQLSNFISLTKFRCQNFKLEHGLKYNFTGFQG